MSVSLSHIDKLLKLILLERNEEVDYLEKRLKQLDVKSAQRQGISISKAKITQMASTMNGKTKVYFEVVSGLGTIFRVGDPIEWVLSKDSDGNSKKSKGKGGDDASKSSFDNLIGSVWRCDEQSIQAIFSLPLDDDSVSMHKHYRLNKVANSKLFERLRESLMLVTPEEIERNVLVKVLLGLKDPEFDDTSAIDFYNDGLNDSQKESVVFALSARHLALIKGPPGTGKTTAVVEIIRQLLKQDLRLLVCTPSNVAVDNILERMPARDDMVRVGPSGKIMSSNMDYSLDRLSARSDAGMLVQSMRQELDRLIQIQLPTSKSRQERKEIYQQMKELRKDIKAREPNIVKSIIKNARIIMTTLASACSKVLEDEKFDVLIIDEACQSTEPECWMAIWKARKVILVGDPHQLPPTILCNDAAKQGLQNTLFSRLLNVYGKKIEKILTVQYRMHPEIMNWCNKLVYNNALFGIPKDDWLLCNMANVEKNDETLAPLVFVDTAGCDYWESLEQEDAKTPKSEQLDRGVSKWNEEEAKVCFNYVKQLVSFGINKSQIAIISPYAAQVRHLKQLLGDDLKEVEVGTVDGFQGREKEVVLVSMVRSNPEGEVGFLADKRRLNVALTRSKRQLWVIADSETLSNDKFMKKMVDYWMEHAEIRYPYMYD